MSFLGRAPTDGFCPAPTGVLDHLKKALTSVQILVEQFWRRWIREYLPTLASSPEKKSITNQVKDGDVVFLVEGDNPRGTWPLGKIIKSYPGPDDAVRVVDVQCSPGIVR
ncbi:hypothetical protein M514_11814 [Trichuris suis]|uniref:DUF5641 domain-containing protein n=1 Tax=Trichuris suis TaxID=68888 RepID=A0A085MSU8_9BILA|nr:hypothetical protein M513_11814 [Trichuris suis]KFD60294.1 hypothetical protein M514_11814 [Trichuris suis]